MLNARMFDRVLEARSRTGVSMEADRGERVESGTTVITLGQFTNWPHTSM